MKFTRSPLRLCSILMIPLHWQSVDWFPIRSLLKKSDKLIFPEFSTPPPQVINNYWCPTEYHAPSHSCIFLVFKYQSYSKFFSYIREEMLFTFKDVHHVVADKFVCKSTTNDTWKKNIPESPFKGILSKRFFFWLYLFSQWSELMLPLTQSWAVELQRYHSAKLEWTRACAHARQFSLYWHLHLSSTSTLCPLRCISKQRKNL